MSDVDKALATQLANIEKRTGKTLQELSQVVRDSGLTKHGELVSMLKSALGMGHGDANTLVHTVRQTAGPAVAAAPNGSNVLDELYTGAKSGLRPVHDAVLATLRSFGDFEEAPKKTYVSYRRKKQFCMVGPATNTRVEVGLNMKGVPATDRLEALPAGQMCQYKVRLADASQVDAELVAWLRIAYDASGS